jgi:hypothetical protein
VLIYERVFHPYNVKLPAEDTRALRDTIEHARDQGYRVRVALIAHDYDLGSAALVFRKPQFYAKFLAQELGNYNRDWVLIVMPNGYGIYRCMPKQREGYADPCEAGRPSAADERLLASLPPPRRSEDFAAAGEAAVRRLAELHGASFGPGLALPVGGGAALLAIAAAGVLIARKGAATAPR